MVETRDRGDSVIHETKNTLGTLAWCNTCGRQTMHSVSGKIRGPCQEHEAQGVDRDGYSQKQIKAREKRAAEERNLKLF